MTGRAALSCGGASCENSEIIRSTNREIMTATGAPVEAYRKFMCVVCGFIYDEEAGLPEEGIAPGTRWEEIPDTWTCPDCGVTKDDFEMIEV